MSIWKRNLRIANRSVKCPWSAYRVNRKKNNTAPSVSRKVSTPNKQTKPHNQTHHLHFPSLKWESVNGLVQSQLSFSVRAPKNLLFPLACFMGHRRTDVLLGNVELRQCPHDHKAFFHWFQGGGEIRMFAFSLELYLRSQFWIFSFFAYFLGCSMCGASLTIFFGFLTGFKWRGIIPVSKAFFQIPQTFSKDSILKQHKLNVIIKLEICRTPGSSRGRRTVVTRLPNLS